jgi:multidrug efflux pump subunit AcrB
VARAVEQALGELRGTVIPTDVEVRITRDYGATANAKVNDLVVSLAEAMITVIALVALAMSLRVGIVVAVAVPITYAITLLVNHLLGYTINRVTLFALILALGMLVDDPIVNVENIARHLGLRREPRRQAILTAINEVIPPVVLATLAIIIAFLPMFFITGMMGPYMRPMAVNVPLAMLCSLAVSLFVTPWVADKLLPRDGGHGRVPAPQETLAYRLYHRLLRPLLQSRARVGALLGAVGILFLGAALLAALGKVPLKMLPFDNKNEFQVVIDLPAGTPLERTAVAVGEVERYLCRVPEVVSYSSVIGTASPMDFNGMVRHYYLRQGQHLADIRVNLLPRAQRAADSHAIVLRLRRDLAAIGQRTGANLKVVEMPPGPPVLATVVAEVCAPDGLPYDRLVAAARQVRARLTAEPGLVDVDDTTTAVQDKLAFHLDRDKAAQNGVTVAAAAAALQLALGGAPAGVLHVTGEQNELPIVIQLPRALRSAPERLRSIAVKGTAGNLVQLGEIGQFVAATVDQPIYHKNQRRVVFVTGEMAGRGPAYAVLALQKHFAANPLPDGVTVNWRGEGEWQITLDVFRDLGIAFAVALFGIYILLVYETTSFLLPVVVMLSIPLTVIGIMPGFWLLNLIHDRPVGGFANPVFFTATAMIGMIALAGIVVRNGIILIDFIRHAVAAGMPVRDAVVASGAVRLRPILLTAGATLLGAWPITMDPIFGGLAWAFIFGLFASTVFTLVVIPAAYFLIIGEAAAAEA